MTVRETNCTMKEMRKKAASREENSGKKQKIHGRTKSVDSEPMPFWLIMPRPAKTPNSKTAVAFVGP